MTIAYTCPSCITPRMPDSTCCSHCGFVFSSPLPTNPPAQCVACHAVQRQSAKVCWQCGCSLYKTHLAVGDVLNQGRYIIQRPLSRGGMGQLYLAADQEAFGRLVVIKVLLSEQDESDERQLRLEGWILASLRHGTIPQVFSCFQHGAQRYLALEYIQGGDLLQGLSRVDEQHGTRLGGSAYAVEQVLRWGITLCRTLEYLHERKPYPIVHQDIKPANIVLDQATGDVFLIDFGNAHLYWPQQPAAHPHQRLAAFGTPGYAPPEQYRGESEPRSDVYALAATLYHLLTDDDPGRHPFSFPQLAQLGPIGLALKSALDSDPRNRPHAAGLRQLLEALQETPRVPRLLAPDGSSIDDEADFVQWCEHHWEAACQWINGSFVEHYRAWRGEKRAQQLRTILWQYTDCGQALDAALALIDPAGFGTSAPRLLAACRAIEFAGAATPHRTSITVTIANTGRRYVAGRIDSPPWLTTSIQQLALAPNQPLSLALEADVAAYRKSNHRHLRVIGEHGVLLECAVRVNARKVI